MSHVCTPSLVGVAFPVLELKFGKITLLDHGLSFQKTYAASYEIESSDCMDALNLLD